MIDSRQITIMSTTGNINDAPGPQPKSNQLKPPSGPLERDSVYQAKALGQSKDGRSAADHDEVLYGTDRQ